MERVVIMVPGEVIELEELKKNIRPDSRFEQSSGNKSSLKEAKERFEKDYIIKALKRNEKNVSHTSKELEIERTNLHRKINQYKIDLDKI